MPPNNTGTVTSGSGDGVDAPQVSGDGSLIGVTAHYDCSFGGSCTPAEGLLRGARIADLGPVGTLIDLQTNQSVSIPQPVSVASNGVVLVRQTLSSGGLAFGIWRQGNFLRCPSQARLFRWLLATTRPRSCLSACA